MSYKVVTNRCKKMCMIVFLNIYIWNLTIRKSPTYFFGLRKKVQKWKVFPCFVYVHYEQVKKLMCNSDPMQTVAYASRAVAILDWCWGSKHNRGSHQSVDPRTVSILHTNSKSQHTHKLARIHTMKTSPPPNHMSIIPTSRLGTFNEHQYIEHFIAWTLSFILLHIAMNVVKWILDHWGETSCLKSHGNKKHKQYCR